VVANGAARSPDLTDNTQNPGSRRRTRLETAQLGRRKDRGAPSNGTCCRCPASDGQLHERRPTTSPRRPENDPRCPWCHPAGLPRQRRPRDAPTRSPYWDSSGTSAAAPAPARQHSNAGAAGQHHAGPLGKCHRARRQTGKLSASLPTGRKAEIIVCISDRIGESTPGNWSDSPVGG